MNKKYKQYCFTWSQQGGYIKNVQGSVIDEASVARTQALAEAQQLKLAQNVEFARLRAESIKAMHNQVRTHEAGAISVLSGFAFSKHSSETEHESGGAISGAETISNCEVTSTISIASSSSSEETITDTEVLQQALPAKQRRKQERKRALEEVASTAGSAQDQSVTAWVPAAWAAIAPALDPTRNEAALAQWLLQATPLNQTLEQQAALLQPPARGLFWGSSGAPNGGSSGGLLGPLEPGAKRAQPSEQLKLAIQWRPVNECSCRRGGRFNRFWSRAPNAQTGPVQRAAELVAPEADAPLKAASAD